jgi:hypothetical protein
MADFDIVSETGCGGWRVIPKKGDEEENYGNESVEGTSNVDLLLAVEHEARQRCRLRHVNA